MIRIIVDSSSDYRTEEIEKNQLELVSLSITIDGKTYLDGVDLDRDLFYQLLTESQTFPKTAQPSPQAFLDVFKTAKEQGDDVICILLSSELSGTCQSASIAKNMADYDNIHIIDSLSATFVIRMLANHACKLRDSGCSATEIVESIEALKSRVKVVAALDTLEYLCKGGRLSKAAAAIGELASIKPMITVSESGSISILGKCIGKNKAISGIIKHIQENTIDETFPVYSIYTYGTANCERLEEKLSAESVQIYERLQVGPTIGAHIGPEAFGIVFVEKE
jgi:DegV family protein with EDD domain